MVTIRPAISDDIAVIRKIVEITWPVAYGEILSAGQIAYMLSKMYSEDKLKEQFSEPDHLFFIAEEDGKELGFTGIQLNYPSKNTMKLHKIYILPEAQGKQTGKQLIDFIRKLAINENQKVISLNVNRSNKAKSFYEKLGFSVVKEENIDIGNGYWMEDFVMELKMK